MFTKKQYRGRGLSKKGGWTVCRFKGGVLGKKERGMLLRGRGGTPSTLCYNSLTIYRKQMIEYQG